MPVDRMSPMAKVLLVPQHDIIIPDFERWYYSARFFNVKPVKSYLRSLDVGMLQGPCSIENLWLEKLLDIPF